MNQTFRLLIAFACIGLVTGCSEKKSEFRFKISGKLTNSKVQKIYLEEIPMATMQNTMVDSADLKKDGSFQLSAGRDRDMIYAIRLGSNTYPSFAVVNDTDAVILNASFTDGSNEFTEQYEINNSPASIKLKQYSAGFNKSLTELYSLDKQADSISRSNPDNPGAINSIVAARKQKAMNLKSFMQSSINNAGNAALAIYILGYYQTTANQNAYLRLEPLDFEDVYSTVTGVSKKFPENKQVVVLKEQLEMEKKKMEEETAQSSRWVGQPAPEINMPDPAGKEVALSSYKGKYVLVDFWASWCGPCRQENPNVVAAFEKFKNKNFTILGVSLDKEKEAWTKAIMKDGLTWKHISDLKQWSSPVVGIYQIQGIPFNVLVNPEGKIIAQNLRGAQLEKKLAEVLN